MRTIDEIIDQALGRVPTPEDHNAAIDVAISLTEWAQEMSERFNGSHFLFNPEVKVLNSRGYQVATVYFDYDNAEAVVSFAGYGRRA